MEYLKRIVANLREEGKINEIQAKMLFSLSTEAYLLESIVDNRSEGEIRSEILKIIHGVSFRISIPQRGVYDDLSSPLDTFLQSKKKHTCSSSFSLVNAQILNMTELVCSSEMNLN